MGLCALIEDRAIGQSPNVFHLHLIIRARLGAAAGREFREQDAVGQFARPFCGFFLGQKLLFGSQGLFALRGLRIRLVLRFVLGKNLFDTCVIQRKWFALIGLLEAVDQGLQLQVGNLLAQALTEAGTQAVSEVVLILVSGFCGT